MLKPPLIFRFHFERINAVVVVGLKFNLFHNALQSNPPKREFFIAYQNDTPRAGGKKTSMSPSRHLGFYAEIQLLGRAFAFFF